MEMNQRNNERTASAAAVRPSRLKKDRGLENMERASLEVAKVITQSKMPIVSRKKDWKL
jgi:hypothetical protein